MNLKKKHFIFVLGILIVLIFLSKSFITLEIVKAHLNQIIELNTKYSLFFKTIFILIYILTVALSLPVATILTLLSGYLFGGLIGTLISLFSASVGAVLAILLVQYFFSEFFRNKYAEKFKAIDQFMSDYSFTTLLSLRLSPIFPYFLTNVFLGLIKVSLRDVFLSSLIGKFPVLYLLSNIGRKLSEIESLNELISWDFFLLSMGLSVLPWLNKWIMMKIKSPNS